MRSRRSCLREEWEKQRKRDSELRKKKGLEDQNKSLTEENTHIEDVETQKQASFLHIIIFIPAPNVARVKRRREKLYHFSGTGLLLFQPVSLCVAV